MADGDVIDLEEVRHWRLEAEIVEAMIGSANLYSDYLRKNLKRPSVVEARAMAAAMGGVRVRADNGTMQPPRLRKEKHG